MNITGNDIYQRQLALEQELESVKPDELTPFLIYGFIKFIIRDLKALAEVVGELIEL